MLIGMDAGFGAEDEYNTYSKPLFERGESAAGSSIYRPRKGDGDVYGDADAQLAKLSDTSRSGQPLRYCATSIIMTMELSFLFIWFFRYYRFKPDKGFQGAEGGAGAGPRDAPVQFERGSSQAAGDRRRDSRQ